MINSVSFASNNFYNKDFSNVKNVQPQEKIIIVDKREQDSFIKKLFRTTANVKKAVVYATEVPKGVAGGTLAGIGAGMGMLALDWSLMKAVGKGLKEQSALTTPFKAIGDVVKSIAKKTYHLGDMSIKQMLAYPFYEGPKQIYEYVKNIKGCSKLGKGLAVAAGLGAATFVMLRTMLNINEKVADIDHRYNVGHKVVK